MAQANRQKRDIAEEESLIETAEFRALVELGDELFGDDVNGPALEQPNEQPDVEDTADLLVITDKFEAPDGDENPGFDPYNNSKES